MEPLAGIAAWIRSLLQNKNQGDIVQDMTVESRYDPNLGPGPGQTAGTWSDENPDQADQYYGWDHNDWQNKIADLGGVGAPPTWRGPMIGGSSLRPDFLGPVETQVPFLPSLSRDNTTLGSIPAWGPDSPEAWKTFPTEDEWNRFNAERWQGHGGLNEETGLPTWIGDMPTTDPRTGLMPWQEGHPYYNKHHAKPDRLRRQKYYQER